MRFYTKTLQYYCGIELHAKTVYVCILDAAVLFIKGNPQAQHWLQKKASRHGKGKALVILAKKLGQTVYAMLSKNRCFDEAKFMAHLQ